MPVQLDLVSEAISIATSAAAEGDLLAATDAIMAIDRAACLEDSQLANEDVSRLVKLSGGWKDSDRGQNGRKTSDSIRDAIFVRDRYICRYAHCRRAVIDDRVVKALSQLIPGALLHHRNWARAKSHPLLWTHLASLEHVQPWSLRGENVDDNLATACSKCNYAKNKATIEQLGWSADPVPSPEDGWDGLLSLLAPLAARVEAAKQDRP